MFGLGLRLIKASRVYDGYFASWRGPNFDKAQALGLHILPVHYYSPIPDIRALNIDDATPKFMATSDDQKAAALTSLADLSERFGDALSNIAARPGPTTQAFSLKGAPYAPVEADLLYGYTRRDKPARIVEIGCGHTTLLMAEAIRDAQADGAYAPNYICIEPYRPDYLKTPPAEVSEFLDKPLQALDFALFDSLNAGDLLFIDSSHVVNYDSDTVHELLRILPRLKPGVMVHIHDIFLPYDYPNDWMQTKRFFWAEQYMLAAFLQDNPTYEVAFPLHQLWKEDQTRLKEIMPWIPDGCAAPGAFWLRRL